MHSKTLIIAGMHRSGTSLITNWLHRCGLQIGETLLEASVANKEGHFEDREFLKIHEDILTSNGLENTGLVYDKPLTISEYQIEKLKAIIRVKDNHFTEWGWKEPRTCLFLDTYHQLLPNAKYLVIVRDYLAVVNSLLKRRWEEIDRKFDQRSFFSRLKWKLLRRECNKRRFYHAYTENFIRVWIDYNQHILRALEQLSPENYLVVNYSLLQLGDKPVYNFLHDNWGFDLHYCPFNSIYKQNLISHQADLSPFIKDQALVDKAVAIENEFQKYMMPD
jgi:hypothetical protein